MFNQLPIHMHKYAQRKKNAYNTYTHIRHIQGTAHKTDIRHISQYRYNSYDMACMLLTGITTHESGDLYAPYVALSRWYSQFATTSGAFLLTWIC